ncbi:hypothetical protein HMPREF0972_02603 [Actinomyces sp. oral taxon 848 str. F0332]|nr:hypothetical protein HMPREF0972_02603 [Actinomyces sp. oral taxon 848 str. F0332]
MPTSLRKPLGSSKSQKTSHLGECPASRRRRPQRPICRGGEEALSPGARRGAFYQNAGVDAQISNGEGSERQAESLGA